MMKREQLLFPEAVKAMQDHAKRAYPNEAVGLITTRAYVPLKNTSDKPEFTATVSAEVVAPYVMDGSLLAVFHSHPKGPNCPSELDMRSQMGMEVPFIIVSTNGDACLAPFAWGDQLEPFPLLERGFQHGVTDCYELIRDHRWLTYGERLPQFPRDWDWWNKGQSLYVDGFQAAGYRLLEGDETPQAGDGFLACIRSRVPNHAGVLVEPGMILHHATARDPYDPSRLAKREPVHRWRDYITHWVRRDVEPAS